MTFAAYKDADNRIKRVFVASKEITSFFTSNYLVSGQNHNAVCFNENDAKSFGVYIRNYDPSSSGVHDGPITYSLTAKLAHINCNDYDTTTDADKLDIWNENSMSISIPPKEVIDAFEAIVSPMDEAIRNNYEEICRLAEIRDSLLPRLMSGELDVSSLDL